MKNVLPLFFFRNCKTLKKSQCVFSQGKILSTEAYHDLGRGCFFFIHFLIFFLLQTFGHKIDGLNSAFQGRNVTEEMS